MLPCLKNQVAIPVPNTIIPIPLSFLQLVLRVLVAIFQMPSLGPIVAIGANTSIKHSIVRESIIGSYTNLYEVVLDNSLIGSDASVKGLSRSLNIGDNTEIDFG